jgi:integrase
MVRPAAKHFREFCSKISPIDGAAGARRRDIQIHTLAHFSGEWTRSALICSIMHDGIQLYDTQGRRLYLTSAERDAFLDAATQADRPIRTLCSVLYYTGCRISEALALTPRRIDINEQTIIFETLKKRRRRGESGVAGCLVNFRPAGHDSSVANHRKQKS